MPKRDHDEAERDPFTHRGRGAGEGVAGRFDRYRREIDLDEWDRQAAAGELPPSPRTTFTPESTRRAITTNDSPDIPFDRSINPYKGCEHGCIYCFARPTHSYLDLSPGIDFETRIFTKPELPGRLRRELAAPGYRCEPIALGTNTDPYQPGERTLRITRGILELLVETSHPFSIVTKSSLVGRDLDLIVPMASRNMAKVFLSVTTLDPELARRMEPRAAAPAVRLETISRLSGAGVPVGVLFSPVIPALNAAELEAVLEACRSAGARYAGYLLVRLPHEVKELFESWLERHYPDRAGKVLAGLRAMRGGGLNDPRFGSRHTGEGVEAELLARRFDVQCRKLGLSRRSPRLDADLFRPPARDRRQGRLFPES